MRNNKFGNKKDRPSKPYKNTESHSEEDKTSSERKLTGPRIGKTRISPKDDKRRAKFSNDRNPNAKRKSTKTSFEPDLSSGPIRLNKYIANSGICSRREADTYINAGVVKVNSKIVTEMGYKVQADDRVEFEGQVIKNEAKVYIVINKPKGVISTVSEDQSQLSVIDIVKNSTSERVYPVGRLDKATTGVMLLTNDGDLTKKLTKTSIRIKKIYQVTLDKDLTKADMEKLVLGVVLEDGKVHAEEISYIDIEDKTKIGLELHSDRNQIVRRLFESLGYSIKKLDRVFYAGLTKKNVQRGRWRYLTEKEVSFLKML